MRTTLLILAVLLTKLRMPRTPRPVRRRPAHRPGEGTVRFRVIAGRVEEESKPGRHALHPDVEAITVSFDRPLFCGQPVEQDGVILHPAPNFWPDSGDLAAVEDEAVTA